MYYYFTFCTFNSLGDGVNNEEEFNKAEETRLTFGDKSRKVRKSRKSRK